MTRRGFDSHNISDHQIQIDPKLCAAARDKSEALAQLAELPKKLDSSSLRPLLWKYGVADFQYLPVSITVKNPAKDVAAIRDYAATAGQQGYAQCGFGLVERKSGGHVATVICARRLADISPFPRQLAASSRVVLNGKLAPGFERPRVFVSQPSGQVSKTEPAMNAGGFEATIAFDGGPGKYLVQVMATGKTGPEVAVLIPVYVETRSPEIFKDIMAPLAAKDPSRGVDARKAEEMMLNAINLERTKMDLRPLKPLDELTKVARQKSRVMAEEKQFGHNIKKTSLEASLKAAMVTYSTAGENASPKMAHYMFMNSPAHRANVLSPVMTHYGVGVEKPADADEYYITEVFVCLEDYR